MLAPDSRPRTLVEIEAKSAGSTRKGVVTTVTRYSDATVWDAMHHRGQLSDRQHRAAEAWCVLAHAAGIGTSGAARTQAVSDPSDLDTPPVMSELLGDDTARDVYRRILRERTIFEALVLDRLCHGIHPAMRLPYLHTALDALADYWGLEK